MSKSQSKSSQTSSTSTTTHNADNRNLVEAGGVAASASGGGVVNMNVTDGGAFDVVSQSIDSIADVHSKSFDGLLDKFGQLLDTGKYVIDQNTKLASETISGFQPSDSARTALEGNKALLIAAGIGAVALVVIQTNK